MSKAQVEGMWNGSRNRQMYRRELGYGRRACTDDRYRDSKLLEDSVIEHEYVIASWKLCMFLMTV